MTIYIEPYSDVGRREARLAGETITFLNFMKSPFSMEGVLVLFVFSGIFKQAKGFAELVPFDATVFLGVILIALLARAVRHGQFPLSRYSFAALSALLVLLSVMAFSVFWSPSIKYATQKLLYLMTFSPLTFFATMYAATDRRRIRNLALTLVFFTSIADIVLLHLLIIAPKALWFLGLLSGGYQATSYFFGLGLVSAMTFIIFSSLKPNVLAFFMIYFASSFFVLLQTGGAGGLLGLALGAVFLAGTAIVQRFWYQEKLRPGAIWLGFGAVLIALYLTYLFSTDALPTSLARILEKISGNGIAPYDERLNRFSWSLEVWSQSPLIGAGLGAWPVYLGLGDTEEYAHNIFLELLSEQGIVGGILLTGFIGTLIVTWIKSKGKIPADVRNFAMAIFIFGMSNALVSGQFSTMRMLWLSFGMLLLVPPHLRDP